MNSLNAEKKYQLSKWTNIIKECKSSGLKVSKWLEQNNISKDQYYLLCGIFLISVMMQSRRIKISIE